MEFITDYIYDDEKRHMLNALTRKTFSFSFEDWVTNGYCHGAYLPFSYCENGRLLANASANIMDFSLGGKTLSYIQIGTVMTDPEYRGRGLASSLIREILRRYEDKTDGIYLFANLNALGFYEKLGFKRLTETRYFLPAGRIKPVQGELLPLADCGDAQKDAYRATAKDCAANALLHQTNGFGLRMFYTADAENVYYLPSLDCYATLEQDGEALTLQEIVSTHKVPLADVLRAISLPYSRLNLGFTPFANERSMLEEEPFDGADDYRLFAVGSVIATVEENKLLFPVFSHA